MTISAENVFGPKARSTRTGASHVVRVDRGATRECAEVRETQSRRVICRYSCPMLQMGLLRAAAGATDAFAASAVRELGLSRCQKLLLQAREEAVWHVANAAQANGCDLARARAAKLLAQ